MRAPAGSAVHTVGKHAGEAHQRRKESFFEISWGQLKLLLKFAFLHIYLYLHSLSNVTVMAQNIQCNSSYMLELHACSSCEEHLSHMAHE